MTGPTLTDAEALALYQTWCRDACDLIDKECESLYDLQTSINFTAGVLYGKMLAGGIPESDAHAYVAKFMVVVREYFDETNWRARNREARGMRLN